MLKGPIPTAATELPHDVIELGPEITAERAKLAVVRLPTISSDVQDGERRLRRYLPQLGRAAVNELSAKLDGYRQRVTVTCEDAPTDSLARLQHDHTDASVMKDSCGLEAGNPGANDRDIRS